MKEKQPMHTLPKVLILGTGSIGERHLRCFRSTSRAELSLCEINPDLRTEVANRYAIPHAFGNYDDALAQEPDAVVICTPAQLHIPLAIQAVNRGKHILIEKPLSTSLKGIEGLMRSVTEKGIVASVAYIHRANPILAAIREAILSNRFGKPLHVAVNSGQYFPLFRPAYREIYYSQRKTGGGAIQDSLTHMFNAVEWLIGPISKLTADASHQSLPGVDVEDTVNVIARHGSVLASYAMNQFQAPNEITIAIACEKGTLRFQAHRLRWSWKTDPEGKWHHEQFAPFERDALFELQAEHFLDAIAGKRPPVCTLEEGLQTLLVNLATLNSADNRCWVDISSG